MRKSLISLCVLTLFSTTGCSDTTRDETDTARPVSTGKSTEAGPTVVKKPVAGESDQTFSLSVPFESIALTQGEEVSVRIGINRGENFGEQVKIELSGLPKGVSLETKESNISQGKTGVDLTLKATADAALGNFTAMVIGHTASSSADFSKEIKLNVLQK